MIRHPDAVPDHLWFDARFVGGSLDAKTVKIPGGTRYIHAVGERLEVYRRTAYGRVPVYTFTHEERAR